MDMVACRLKRFRFSRRHGAGWHHRPQGPDYSYWKWLAGAVQSPPASPLAAVDARFAGGPFAGLRESPDGDRDIRTD